MGLIEYLGDLKSVKDDWKEEIPEEIIHSTAKDNKYKVRKAWFQIVNSSFANGLQEGYLCTFCFLPLYRRFQQWASETGFHPRDTTKEDIQFGNETLNMLIEHVEYKLRFNYN